MKKFAVAAPLVVIVLLIAFAVSALAGGPEGPPRNGPHRNPCDPRGPFLQGVLPDFCNHQPDEKLIVADEPAGENCVNGGIKVTVVKGKLDGSNQPSFPDQIPPGAVEPSEDPGVVTTNGDGPPLPPVERRPRPPRPDSTDQVFYVCDGAVGPVGPAGPAGPIGPQGPAGAPGVAIPTPLTPKVCQSSTRIGVRLFLPPRLARFGVVRLQIAKVNGPLRFDQNVRTRVPRSGPGGVFVFVPIRNRNCGSYLISVGRPGVEPVIQIWQITGRFGLKRTTITG